MLISERKAAREFNAKLFTGLLIGWIMYILFHFVAEFDYYAAANTEIEITKAVFKLAFNCTGAGAVCWLINTYFEK